MFVLCPPRRDEPRQTIGAHRETLNLVEGVAPSRIQHRLLAVERRRMKRGRLLHGTLDPQPLVLQHLLHASGPCAELRPSALTHGGCGG